MHEVCKCQDYRLLLVVDQVDAVRMRVCVLSARRPPSSLKLEPCIYSTSTLSSNDDLGLHVFQTSTSSIQLERHVYLARLTPLNRLTE